VTFCEQSGQIINWPVSPVMDVLRDAVQKPFGVVTDIIVSESYFYLFFHFSMAFIFFSSGANTKDFQENRSDELSYIDLNGFVNMLQLHRLRPPHIARLFLFLRLVFFM